VVSEGAGDGEKRRLQEAAVPPANYVHPEFGYLCPTSRLRRDFRVAVVSIALGGIIGAGIVAFRMAHDRDTVSSLMVAHVAHPAEAGAPASAEAVPEPAEAGNAKLEAIKTDRTRIGAVKPDTAEPVTDGAKTETAKTERVKNDNTKADSTKADGTKAESGKTDGAKSDAAKQVCQDNTWAYLDGTCVASKPRRVKVRAATDSPAIGAAPIGRTVSTSVAAPAPAAVSTPQSLATSAPPSNATAPSTASSETSQPSVATSKRPQKTARSHSRTGNDRSVREPRGYAGYATPPGAYRQGANQGFFGWFW
jgi:hypothetical protein